MKNTPWRVVNPQWTAYPPDLPGSTAMMTFILGTGLRLVSENFVARTVANENSKLNAAVVGFPVKCEVPFSVQTSEITENPFLLRRQMR